MSDIVLQIKASQKMDYQKYIDTLGKHEKQVVLLAINHKYKAMGDAIYHYGENMTHLPEHMQVFAFRYIYLKIIFELIDQPHENVHEDTVTTIDELIQTIEHWQDASDFKLNIQWFIDRLSDLNEISIYKKEKYTKNALLLIEENITSSHLNVKWLADRLDISTTHLSNLFKKTIHQSISTYIRDEKIKAITNELKYSSLSLHEIREKFGFTSASYFSQFFKRATGETPLHYMKAHR